MKECTDKIFGHLFGFVDDSFILEPVWKDDLNDPNIKVDFFNFCPYCGIKIESIVNKSSK